MTYLRNIFKEQSFADISLSLDSLEIEIVWRPLPSWSTSQLRYPSGFPRWLQIESGWVYTEYNYRALTVKNKKDMTSFFTDLFWSWNKCLSSCLLLHQPFTHYLAWWRYIHGSSSLFQCYRWWCFSNATVNVTGAGVQSSLSRTPLLGCLCIPIWSG